MKKNSVFFQRQTIEYPLYISLLRYFEFYEERVSQRNVTKNVSTCCQGYIKTTEKCLLSKYTIIKQASRLIFPPTTTTTTVRKKNTTQATKEKPSKTRCYV